MDILHKVVCIAGARCPFQLRIYRLGLGLTRMCHTRSSSRRLVIGLQHLTVSLLASESCLLPGWTPRLDGSLVIEHEVIAAALRAAPPATCPFTSFQVKDSVVARMILGHQNSVLHDLKQQARADHRGQFDLTKLALCR